MASLRDCGGLIGLELCLFGFCLSGYLEGDLEGSTRLLVNEFVELSLEFWIEACLILVRRVIVVSGISFYEAMHRLEISWSCERKSDFSEESVEKSWGKNQLMKVV
ncbi:hypothetical protein Tco_0758795 [Tanacetum coccineum]